MEWTGTRVRALRTALLATQEEFGQRVGVDPRTVRNWESDRHRPILLLQRGMEDLFDALSPRQQQRFNAALGPDQAVSVAPTSTLQPAVALQFDTPAHVDPSRTDVKRREFLEWFFAVASAIVAGGPSPAVLIEGQEPSSRPAVVDAITQQYRVLFQGTPSYHLTQPVLEHLRLVAGLAREARSNQEHAQLLASLGQIAQLAGRLCFDANDYASARTYHKIAMQAGQESGSSEVFAYALGCLASIANDCGYPREAILLLTGRHGRTAAEGTSAVTRAWLAALEAEAYALLDDRDRSLRAIEQAQAVFSRPGGREPPAWLQFFDAARLRAYQGACSVHLGLLDAEQLLQQAAAALDSVYSKRRSAVMTDLAALYVRSQRFEEAQETIVEAKSLAGHTHSRIYLHRARSVEDRFRQVADARQVAQLEERLRSSG